MDNLTLLQTLTILLGINAIFTYIISNNIEVDVAQRWRWSSILIFSGTILLLSQGVFPYWISIIFSNFLVLLGFYFQMSAALHFEIKSVRYEKFVIAATTAMYLVGFYYYTFVDFNTTSRVIILSALIFLLYVISIAVLYLKTRNLWSLISREVWLLFYFSCLFFLARSVITVIEVMTEHRIHSLFDKDLLTSITFLYSIIHHSVFLNGMFKATLRDKNLILTRDKNRFTYLFEFLNDTAKHLDLLSLYKSIESVLRKSFGVPTGAIYLKDKDKSEYSHTMAYIFNELGLPISEVKTFKMGEGLSGQAVEQQQVVIVDIDHYPNQNVASEFKNKGVTHLVSIPLIVSNDILGAITIVYSIDEIKEELFDKKFLRYLGEQISLVLYNAILYNQLSGVANTDFLTGLYNRRKLQELFYLEGKRNKRKNRVLTVALIDLDFFKKINDTYGHECGDDVIKNMAAVLKDCCRDTDYICRWGGEEFLVLFVETSLTQAVIAAERIRIMFSQTTCECMNGATVTASIGLAEMANENETLDEITFRADIALYQAKNNGRNQVCSAENSK